MNKTKFLSSFLSILLLAGCSQQPTYKIDLPVSDFHTDGGPWSKGIHHFVDIVQASDSSVTIEWDTVQKVPIDSMLHYALFQQLGNDLTDNDLWIKVRLYLDHRMPIETVRQIQLECRKIDIWQYWLVLEDSTAISTVLPPIREWQRTHIHPQIVKELPTRHLLPPVKDILNESNIIMSVAPGTRSINQLVSATEITDYRAYLLEYPKVVTVYQFDDNCTYQDYISTLGFLYSTVYGLRKEAAAADTSLTKRELKKLHPLRNVDMEYLLGQSVE